jgi:hypothetical protein
MISRQKIQVSLLMNTTRHKKSTAKRKNSNSLDRHDDVWRHAQLFNQIGKIVQQHRRSPDQGEQQDAHDRVEGEPSNQCYLRRDRGLPPSVELI